MAMTFAQKLRQAARFNPAWRPVRIYVYALDTNGEPIVDANGAFTFDISEVTVGFLDRRADDNFDVSVASYTGDSELVVVTDLPPDPSGIVWLDGLFYQLSEVLSADVLAATVKYKANSLPDGEVPNIRTDAP